MVVLFNLCNSSFLLFCLLEGGGISRSTAAVLLHVVRGVSLEQRGRASHIKSLINSLGGAHLFFRSSLSTPLLTSDSASLFTLF